MYKDKITIALLSVILCAAASVFSQTPSIRYISHSGEAIAMAGTPDGGIILSGHYWDGIGNEDPLIVALDPRGKVRWARLCEGPEGDYSESVAVTSDGTIYTAVSSRSFGTITPYGMIPNLLVIKMDLKGRILWKKIFGANEMMEHALVAATSDGGVVVATGLDRELFLLRLDSSGRLLWQRRFLSESDGDASFVAQTKDGGYLMGGFLFSASGAAIIRLDAGGNLLWARGYPDLYKPNSILETIAGDFIMSGISWNSSADAIVAKVDAQGTPVWARGFTGDFVEINSTNLTSNGEILVAGARNGKALFMRLSADGKMQWRRTLDRGDGSAANAVLEKETGKYIFAGRVSFYNDAYSSPILLGELDSKGNAGDCDTLLSPPVYIQKMTLQSQTLGLVMETQPALPSRTLQAPIPTLHLGTRSACSQ